MPWRPSESGEVPTLGWDVLDWMQDLLAAPDRAEYEPFIPTNEQAKFVLRYYEINALTGRRVIRRGVISRPRGWGKSPFLAALACVEALGPVVPDGWDAAGQPVGRPWSTLRTPLVQVAASSEAQTKNSYAPLKEMLDGPALAEFPGLEPMDTFIALPRGRIEAVSSSARSVKGNKAVFAILDQTEEWTKSNGGVRLAQTMRINAAKLGGSTVESPNAYTPGEDSVAEATARWFAKLNNPHAAGLLYDHREAPADTSLEDRESLLAGLQHAYGDSADTAGGWVDLDRIIDDINDPAVDVQVARADFLNQITHASDSWLAAPEWNRRAAPAAVLADGDMVTLGFDGSVRDDATALAVCRVSDGHVQLLERPGGDPAVWERPDGPIGRDWQVPREQVHTAVAAAMDRFTVVGFYADPPQWQDAVDDWTARYGRRMRVRATQHKPLHWYTQRGTQMVAALERFREAVLSGELSHDGDSSLRRHVLNARRRMGRAGLTIAKEFPQSPNKIDAAMAAVLAYEARADAVALGLGRARAGRTRTGGRQAGRRAHGF